MSCHARSARWKRKTGARSEQCSTIRLATAVDLDALEPVLPDFLRTPYKRGRFAHAIANGQVSVIERDGALAGFLWLTDFFGHTFVNALAVDERQRRRGHARTLLAFAQRHAVTDRLFISTNRSNVVMHALLQRDGWTRCGEVDHIDAGDPEVFYVIYPRAGVRPFDSPA